MSPRKSNVMHVWVVLTLVSVLLSCGGPAARSGVAGGSPAMISSATEIQCPARGPLKAQTRYHSQFYEDYVLAYVFQDVRNGVYVDVGAWDPDLNTVTKYFYLEGWRGINFEPNPELIEKLEQARPEDVNLGIGVSDTAGELTFYQLGMSGLSTFDPAIAERYRASGMVRELEIPVSTLNTEFASQPMVQKGITFLTVDVEGFEKQVFTGLDFERYQPQVILAEARAPLSEVATYGAWEPILTRAGYVFAMDDGLNRYYVHSSRTDLLPRFVEANYCVGMDKLDKHIQLDGFKEVGPRQLGVLHSEGVAQ